MDFWEYDVVLDCARDGGAREGEIRCVARGAGERSTSRARASDAHERAIEDIWAVRVAKNPNLFNGSKFRLARVECATDEGRAEIQLGVTDYKTFLATNLWERWETLIDRDEAVTRHVCSRVAWLRERGRYRHFADALGNCVCLRSADDKYLFLKRSENVGEAPGYIVFPGGHGEPSEVGFVDGADPGPVDVAGYLFRNIEEELEQELGVASEHIRDLRLLGITRRRVNARSCMVFSAQTSLTSEQIINEHYPRAKDAFESSSAVALRLADVDVARVPGDHAGAIALVLAAASHRPPTP